MKQTNNAIKFLMAQYRAVFKQAYFKGLVSAVALSSSLAVFSSAQANPFITTDGNNWQEQAYTDAVSGSIAGAYSGNTGSDAVTVSGASLDIIHAINKTTDGNLGYAYGGRATSSTGAAAANANTLNVNATVAGHVYGGDATSSGNTTTNDNIVNVNSHVSGGVYGGRALISASSTDANAAAIASENQVFVNASAQVDGLIYGGLAQGVKVLETTDNIVKVTGNQHNASAVIMGGLSWTANASGSANISMLSKNNQVTLDGIKYNGSGADGTVLGLSSYAGTLQYIGGIVIEDANISGKDALSQGNQLTLSNSEIKYTTPSSPANAALKIVANYSDTTDANAVAKGDSSTPSLVLNNTTVAFSGQADNIVAGGFAKSSTNGSASVSDNIVEANSSTLSGIDLYGAYAEAANGTTAASGNKLNITKTTSTDGDIFGAFLNSKTTTQTATANQNSVIIDAASSIEGNVFGANIAAGSASASGNSVEVSGEVKGGIYGVHSEVSGTFTGNSVTIHGSHGTEQTSSTNPLIIVGTYVNATTGNNVLSGNSVTIASDAVLNNAKIYAAVQKGGDSSTITNSNNDININGQVLNSDIFGGSGAESVVTVAENALVKIDDGKAHHIYSDAAQIDGKLEIADAQSTLNLAGFFKNGTDTDTNLNAGTFSVTGEIVNNGTLHLLSGSTLDMLSGSSLTGNGTLHLLSGSTLDMLSGSSLTGNGTLKLASSSNAKFDIGALAPSTSQVEITEGQKLTYITTNIDNIGKVELDKNASAGITFHSQQADADPNFLTIAVVTVDNQDKFIDGVTYSLNNVRLKVEDDLELTTNHSNLPSGQSGKYFFRAFGGDSYLMGDNINYTSSSKEDLKGINLFANDTLTFVDTNGAGNSVVVYGIVDDQAPNHVFSGTFGGYKVTTSSGKDLHLNQGVVLNMHNPDFIANKTGNIDVNLLLSNKGTKLQLFNLDVTAKDITLDNGASLTALSPFSILSTTLQANTLTLGNSSTAVFEDNTALTVKKLVNNGSFTGTNSEITILGDGKGDTVELTGSTGLNLTGGLLDLSIANDTVGLKYDTASQSWSTGNGFNKVVSNGTTIKVDLTNAVTGTLSIDAANAILGTLTTNSNGLVSIVGDIKPDLPVKDDPVQGSVVNASDIADENNNITLNFDTAESQKSVLTGVKGIVSGGWKAVITSGSSDVNITSGTLKIYDSTASGSLVETSTGTAANVNVGANASFEVSGQGKVGAVSGDGSMQLNAGSVIESTGSIDIHSLNATQAVLSADKIKADQASFADTQITGNSFELTGGTGGAGADNAFSLVNSSMTLTGNLDLRNAGESTIKGSLVTAASLDSRKAVLTFEQSNLNLSADSQAKDLIFDEMSSIKAEKQLTLENLHLMGNSTGSFETLVLANNNGVVQVGSEYDPSNLGNLTDTLNKSSTASLFARRLDLNGGLLVVDPDYTQNTALTVLSSMGSTPVVSNKDTTDVGETNGNIFVGQNSALGLGLSSLDELQAAIANYQKGNALDPERYGALAYINGTLTINQGNGITLTALSQDGFARLTNGKSGWNGIQGTNYKVTANSVFFGDNTALIINGDELNNQRALITFEDNGTKQTNTLIAQGGRILVDGDLKTNISYKIFGTESQDSVVQVKDLDNKDAQIEVATENNLLVGFLNTSGNGSVFMEINEDEAYSIINAASRPVTETILAYGRGYNGPARDEADVAEGDRLYALTSKNEKDYKGYYNYFLQQEFNQGNGSATEKAARLGIYGGAAQAALTAGSATYEAVNGRMGMGAQTGSITFADNTQGAGLWVAPIYRNQDSDSFGAQGLSYGADLDLFGAALGGDFTLSNGLRVGAAFAVGSGDADGQGAGAGVSNDFDYYGFTIYGGYTLDQFSVVADVSYTAVDNDVSADTMFEKISAHMDSSTLSVGATAQYVMNYNNLEITPHAGLRYTWLDMDDYTVKGSENIANYHGDSMSIFSIPVGVTFSKEITAGQWTIKPAFDVTLTANVGDDSIDGDVTWTGVENLKTNLESEVIDSFTYGAALGLSAKYNNFSMGLGINYTGASNADAYGVTANVRLVF